MSGDQSTGTQLAVGAACVAAGLAVGLAGPKVVATVMTKLKPGGQFSKVVLSNGICRLKYPAYCTYTCVCTAAVQQQYCSIKYRSVICRSYRSPGLLDSSIYSSML